MDNKKLQEILNPALKGMLRPNREAGLLVQEPPPTTGDVNSNPDVWQVLTGTWSGGAGVVRYDIPGYSLTLEALHSPTPNDTGLGNDRSVLPFAEVSFNGTPTGGNLGPAGQRVRIYAGQTLEVPGGFRFFSVRFDKNGGDGTGAYALRIGRLAGVRLVAHDSLRVTQDSLQPWNVAGPPGELVSGTVTGPGANTVIPGADTGQIFGGGGYYEVMVDLSTSDTGKEMVIALRNAANSADVLTMRYVASSSPHRAHWPSILIENQQRIVVRVGAAPTAGTIYDATIYWRRVDVYVAPT